MLEFFVAALVVALAPGPDNLFVLAQSATHGAKAGFCVICGLCTGIVIQVCLLILGVVKLDESGETRDESDAGCEMRAESASVILSERSESKDPDPSGEGAGLSFRRLYLRGIIMNLTNPKAVLFALSFIPPAVDMNRDMSPSLQMVVLGAEFVTATFIVFGSIALLAGAVKKFMLNSPKANRNLNWFSGCVFIALAIALILF